MRFESDRETGLMPGFLQEAEDAIFAGRDFARRLARSNLVVGSSAMMRKTSLDKVGLHPLDMPFAADWYMWALLALHGDVGYIAEPLVNYRWHPQNMTQAHQANRIAMEDEIRLRWRIRQKAREAGAEDVTRAFEDALVVNYATRLAEKRDRDWTQGLTMEEFDRSLDTHAADAAERAMIRRRVLRILADCFSFLGKRHHAAGDLARARRCYGWAIQQNPAKLKTLARWLWLTASGTTKQR